MPSCKQPAIISASRRTDIPAFHMEWMLERLRAGFADVPNPRNPRQIRHVELTRGAAGCIVFWTKNPAPLLDRIDELEAFGIPFGVLFTLNAYGTDLEPGVPPLETRIAAFLALSRRIGPEKLVWRYDPIALSPRCDREFHLRNFQRLAGVLGSATERCIVSFLDFYARTVRNTRGLELYDPVMEEKNALASELEAVGRDAGIRLESCAEANLCLPRAACIGEKWIEAICGRPLSSRKDPGQRPLCNCVASIDIGTNGTCQHNCRYCYAQTGTELR